MANLQQRIHVLREGVTIAIDSIRANKVRAGLTILGIAVGVFVVVVISAAIHGINASVAKDLESTGPTTFFVSRFPISFEACDGTDETCKFFRNPRLTLADVDALQRLPTVRTAGARLDTQRGISYKDRRIRSVDVGFPAREYLAVGIETDVPPTSGVDDEATRAAQRARFGATLEALRERVQAEPGVTGVTFVDHLPRLYHPQRLIELDEPSGTTMASPREVNVASVDPSYFDVLGAPILAGRGFHAGESAPRSQVVIVDQAFV